MFHLLFAPNNENDIEVYVISFLEWHIPIGVLHLFFYSSNLISLLSKVRVFLCL